MSATEHGERVGAIAGELRNIVDAGAGGIFALRIRELADELDVLAGRTPAPSALEAGRRASLNVIAEQTRSEQREQAEREQAVRDLVLALHAEDPDLSWNEIAQSAGCWRSFVDATLGPEPMPTFQEMMAARAAGSEERIQERIRSVESVPPVNW